MKLVAEPPPREKSPMSFVPVTSVLPSPPRTVTFMAAALLAVILVALPPRRMSKSPFLMTKLLIHPPEYTYTEGSPMLST
jgi:hypothetical protein